MPPPIGTTAQSHWTKIKESLAAPPKTAVLTETGEAFPDLEAFRATRLSQTLLHIVMPSHQIGGTVQRECEALKRIERAPSRTVKIVRLISGGEWSDNPPGS
jgi:hypothetical protein